MAFLEAVNVSRPFVVVHDGDRYWPDVSQSTDQQERVFELDMNRVHAFAELPTGAQREVRRALRNDGTYTNRTLRYLDWAGGGRHILSHDGRYYVTCVLASGGQNISHHYQLQVDALHAVQNPDTTYC
ncbi:MAG: hypothetical protein ABEJ08_00405 [Halobacteriaceae archaeon]